MSNYMTSTANNTSVLRNTGKALIITLVMLAVVSIQFRVQILNNFSVLYGDSYDATIAAVIMEHWFSVFQGNSSWSQLYYFYPYTNTLAQTDGYFLIGVIYSAIRMFGFDPYLSSEWSNMVVRVIGFFAFYLMCRKMFSFNFWWSVLAAALFILSNNLTLHGHRVQLATVGFAPIMALLMFYAYQAFAAGDRNRTLKYGVSAGIFLGAWSITCFYITWFFIFFTLFFIATAFLFTPRDFKRNLWQKCKESYLTLTSILVVAIIAQLPLLSVYLPKAKETGMRSYETAFAYTVPLQGIVQTGHENILFGELYNKFVKILSPTYAPSGEYYNTGIAPILFLFFLAGAWVAIRRRKEANSTFLWPAVSIASLITWLFVLNIGGHSAWFFVYSLVPGAKALNVVGAYQIFLSIPVILLAVWYLSKNSSRIPAAVLIVIVGLLGLEELNRGYIVLNRADELAKSEVHATPPSTCTSFYVGGWPNQDPNAPANEATSNIYAHNVSAMLIAEKIRLPTINGMASFNPKDWNFSYPNRPDYEQRIKQYSDAHKLTNVCKLDLKSKTWSLAW